MNTRVKFIAEAAKRDDTAYRNNAQFYCRDLLLHIHGLSRESKSTRPEQDTKKLAWALQVHEDLCGYVCADGGNMLHVRADRALGILFAEIERLEKIAYPMTAHEPRPALQSSGDT